jgi:hypothetical protein
MTSGDPFLYLCLFLLQAVSLDLECAFKCVLKCALKFVLECALECARIEQDQTRLTKCVLICALESVP